MIYIIANWKCNPESLKRAGEILDLAEKESKNKKDAEIIICAPFVYLSSFKNLNTKLGAQNCFWEEGAYTGEVSCRMIKNAGCEYVMIGHSERRKLFNETDETVNKKINAALSVGLKPILCIGETEAERKENKTKDILKDQLEKDLKDIKNSTGLIVAYEPVWSIGTGNACGIPDAKTAYDYIKTIVGDTPVVYGGSVNSKNSEGYIKEAGFQGLLVGGASLIPEEFAKIVKNS